MSEKDGESGKIGGADAASASGEAKENGKGDSVGEKASGDEAHK